MGSTVDHELMTKRKVMMNVMECEEEMRMMRAT
jgi:hypothetical protein